MNAHTQEETGAVAAAERTYPTAYVSSKTSRIEKVSAPRWATISAGLSKITKGKKDGKGWMPADIAVGQRCAERVKAVTMLVLDIEADAEAVLVLDENGQPAKDEKGKNIQVLDEYGDIVKRVTGKAPPSFDEMIAELDLWGWRYILHTSYSHTAEHERFRLILDLSRSLVGPVKGDHEIKLLAPYVAERLGLSYCTDKSCIESGRFFYTPRAPSDARLALFRHASGGSAPLDVAALLSEAAAVRQAVKQSASTSKTAKTGGVIDAFDDAHDIGAVIERNGYDPAGRDRWIFIGSSTGMPGVRLLPERNGKQMVFSSHSGDPLNDGHAHDAFSAWCILEHNGEIKKAVAAAAKLLGLGRDNNPPSRGADETPDDALEGFEDLTDVALDAPSAETTAVAFYVPRLFGTDARDGTRTSRALTEHGNALRLLDAHGARLRYCPEIKAWLVWNGAAWTWSADGSKVREAAAHLSKTIYREGLSHIADAEYFVSWAKHSQKKSTIAAAVALLSDTASLRVPVATIDADQFIAGFDQARQVIDLATGTARAATQSDYVTKAIGSATIGNASEALRWRQFLNEVFDGDLELIDWIQRFCGYMLTGSTREHIFLFAFGLGANGKSVFIELLNHIMGDYARAITSATLSDTKRAAGSATTDLASLLGARMALCSETEDNTPLAESLVKSLVSGDTMSVRKLYCEPFDATPNFKLVMAGNHKPIVRGNDYGLWRRVRLVPFNVTFSKEKRDPRLLDKLKAETPHILAWMVEGCLAWQERGLGDTPECVQAATDQYRADQDLIGQWLEDCTTQGGQGEAGNDAIYASYAAWSENSGLRPASKVALGRRLSERGFTACRNRKGRFWGGLKLNEQNTDFLDLSA